MTHFTRHCLPLSILLAAACGGREAPDTFSVRDSAGIAIYDNFKGEWTEATAWRLSSEPILTIGTLDGPEEYQLFRVRGALRLSNGGILITNGGTHELRFYDSNGTHIQSVGREGEGPGEFKLMAAVMRLRSDSIFISDFGNARLTVFDINGALGRSFRLDPVPDGGTPFPLGILADTSLLVYSTIRSEEEPQQGLRRDSVLYARYSLDGAYLTTLTRRQGSERYVSDLGGGRIAISSAPYGRNPLVTVSGNRWYFGSGDSWEIEVHSPDGALTHLFRRDEPNRPITKEIEDAYREAASNSGSNMPAAFTRMRASMPIPETMPAYRSFIVSDNGSLWVQNYTRSSEQPSWAVFRGDGRYLGDVDTPISARVMHIGDDFVLVSWEDELEVEYVQMYELIIP